MHYGHSTCIYHDHSSQLKHWLSAYPHVSFGLILAKSQLCCAFLQVGNQAAKSVKDAKKAHTSPMKQAKTKNELAKQALEAIERHFPLYERRHIHLELDETGSSLFQSVVSDFMGFQAEGRSQVPMGYYRRKKRQFPGPRLAYRMLQVPNNALCELIVNPSFGSRSCSSVVKSFFAGTPYEYISPTMA